MPKQTVLAHKNWAKLLNKSKYIKFDAKPFEFWMEFDKEVEKALRDNPVIQAKLWEPAQDLWKKMIASMDNLVANADKTLDITLQRLKNPSDIEKAIAKEKKELIDAIDDTMGEYIRAMDKAVMKRWEELKKQKKLSLKLKIKTAAKGLVRITAMTFSVGTLVASGGLNVLAWVSLTRNVVATMSEFKKLAISVDKFALMLEKQVRTLHVAMGKDVAVRRAMTAGSFIAFAALGTTVKTTYASTHKNLKVFNGRVAALEQSHNALGKRVEKALKAFQKDRKRLPSIFAKDADKLERHLNTVLIKTSQMGGKIEDYKKLAIRIEKSLNSMATKKSRNILAGIQTALTLTTALSKVAVSILLVQSAGAIEGLQTIGETLAKEVPKHAGDMAKVARAA